MENKCGLYAGKYEMRRLRIPLAFLQRSAPTNEYCCHGCKYEVEEDSQNISILIFIPFRGSLSGKVNLFHILKLFQSGPDAMLGKKMLVSEFYEEIVFQDPTVYMQSLLTNTRQLTIGPWKHETDFEEKKEKTLQNILSAKVKIRQEINDLKERLKLAKETIGKFKTEISKLQTGPSVMQV